MDKRKTGGGNTRKSRKLSRSDGPKRKDDGLGRMKVETGKGSEGGKDVAKRDPDRRKIIKTGTDVIGEGAKGGERKGIDKTSKEGIKSNNEEERTKGAALSNA